MKRIKGSTQEIDDSMELTGIGHRNFVDFIGIEPNFIFSAAEDGGSQPLLKLEGHHDDFFALGKLAVGEDESSLFSYPQPFDSCVWLGAGMATLFDRRDLAACPCRSTATWAINIP